MNMLGAIRERLCREEWNIGIVEQSAADIVNRGIQVPNVRWFPSLAPWGMLADPAPFFEGGETFILAEYLDYWSGKGEIWSAKLPNLDQLSTIEFEPAIAEVAHLSYPCPIANQYLVVESWEANALHLYTRSNQRWHFFKPVLQGEIVDPTVWYDDPNDRYWLFCTLRDRGANEHLYLYYGRSFEGEWTPHPKNPVKSDIRSARSAGPIFEVDGRLIRPAQDCSSTYGGALTLNAIIRLDPEDFAEETIRHITPPSAEYPHGIHTLAPCGNVTVIDGKHWAFHPLDVVRRIKLLGASEKRQRQAREARR